jgi:hypothetical protein
LLVKGSEAHPDQLAIRLTFFLALAHGRQINELGSARERGGVIAVVERLLRDGHIWHLRRLHEVTQPHFYRIDTDGVGDAVHEKLVADARQWARHAAKRLAGGFVTHNVYRPAPKSADVIAALHIADRQAAFDSSGPRPGRIRAGVNGDVAFESQHATVRIRVCDDFAMVVATVRVTNERFVTVLNPADGTS